MLSWHTCKASKVAKNRCNARKSLALQLTCSDSLTRSAGQIELEPSNIGVVLHKERADGDTAAHTD